MTRRTDQNPLGISWGTERKRRDEGRKEKKERRQGVREHYSVESDALPENEWKEGITRKIYGVNVYNLDGELPYMSADLYTTRNVYMRETRVV